MLRSIALDYMDLIGLDDSLLSSLPAVWETLGSIPGLERYPGEGNGSPLQHSAWKIPWTEEPGRLQSIVSQSDMTSDFHFHSCFTILCWFLLYSNGNQLCVCIHRLPPGPPPTPTPSHPPGVTIELQAEPRVLCCRLLVQMSRECS